MILIINLLDVTIKYNIYTDSILKMVILHLFIKLATAVYI